MNGSGADMQGGAWSSISVWVCEIALEERGRLCRVGSKRHRLCNGQKERCFLFDVSFLLRGGAQGRTMGSF